MVFELRIKPKAQKKLESVPKEYRARVIRILEDIAQDPFAGKKLRGKLAGQYSVKVWPYRIVYMVFKRELVVLVVEFGHRGGVY